MALFSRKKSKPEPAAVDDFIGRRFRSDLSVAECIANFSAVKDECYQTAGDLQDVPWVHPAPPATRPEFSDGPAAVPPARFVANDLVGGGRIYLAIWEGMVGYGAPGVGGPPCEMWFVPPAFDNTPIPIAGTWARVDGSLSSIGLVERAYWGA